MNTIVQKYGVALASFFVTVLTAVSVIQTFNAVSIIQVIILAVSSAVVFFVPLLPGGWRGALKTILDVIGAALLLIVPFVVAGHITGPQVVVVIIGVVKALATELGVVIRTDKTLVAAPAAVLVKDDGAVPNAGT